MQRIWIPLAAAVSGLTLLTGCGGGTEHTPGTGAPPATAAGGTGTGTGLSEDATKRHAAEKLIADCMKRKGFQYEVPPAFETSARSSEFTGTSSLLKTDDEVRQYRQKYGFGIYSAVVWPDDPMVKRPVMNPNRNPNNRIRAALDPARQEAWDAALASDPKVGRGTPGCADAAYEQLFGSKEPDPRQEARKKRDFEQYRTDPAVVKAALAYADCLRGKGYQVASTEPGILDNGVHDLINAPVGNGATVTVAEAKKRLPEEIRAALADVDCRGDYAKLARTRYAEVVVHGGGVG